MLKPQQQIDTQSLPQLDLYSRVIAEEALRRGIAVEVVDPEECLLAYRHGERCLLMRMALSEASSALALAICDDKGFTRRLLERAGLRVPAQGLSDGGQGDRDFLARYRHIVVKPRRGEQGRGVAVDIHDEEAMREAIATAREEDDEVLLEEFVQGEDLRVLVIDGDVVAAAVRRPPRVRGNGRDSIEKLIREQSRRREQETSGESHIPLDDETRRCVEEAGWRLDQVPPEGETLVVRKTNNLHTGGTITDVTDDIHPRIRAVARQAAQVLRIPLVGVDFLMPDLQGEDYVIIEANENPGLANHEPRPTVQRYLDYLFPATRGLGRRDE